MFESCSMKAEVLIFPSRKMSQFGNDGGFSQQSDAPCVPLTNDIQQSQFHICVYDKAGQFLPQKVLTIGTCIFSILTKCRVFFR